MTKSAFPMRAIHRGRVDEDAALSPRHRELLQRLSSCQTEGQDGLLSREPLNKAKC
jgi:hypothetical protein